MSRLWRTNGQVESRAVFSLNWIRKSWICYTDSILTSISSAWSKRLQTKVFLIILISCPESHFCSSKSSASFSINEEFDLNPECRKLAENVDSSQRFYGFSWVCHQQISMHITHLSSDIFENVKLLQGNWKECKNSAKGTNSKWRLICNSLLLSKLIQPDDI